jgi:hypothetical protein
MCTNLPWQDDLNCQVRDAISDRNAAQRAEKEADLRWSKSACAIQQERDRCAQLQVRSSVVLSFYIGPGGDTK